MRYNILNFHDLLIAPLIFVIIFVVARFLKRKYTRNNPIIRKYFMPALCLRLLGCFLSAIMYQYYYQFGDTFEYFNGVMVIWETFWKNPSQTIEILMYRLQDYSFETVQLFMDKGIIRHATGADTSLVIKIGGVLGLLTGGSYLAIGFILTFFSFLGCWKIFEVFIELYPHLHKKIAISTLFIPSVFFWGAAGLMKDTIVLAALGYTFWGTYNLFIRKKNKGESIIFIVIGSYVTLIIKTYIILALLPALLTWIFLIYNSRIKNKALRKLSIPLFTSFILLVGVILIQLVMKSGDSRYSPETILLYTKTMQQYHLDLGGSSYDLGEYDLSVFGLLKMLIPSINVALFRPYIWEIKSIILIPAVIESVIFFFLTIYTFLKIGFFRTIKIISRNPTIIFCLLFSLTFAFAVGFTTYNFGALARYKIPCLPFYLIAIFLILDQGRKRRKFVKPN